MLASCLAGRVGKQFGERWHIAMEVVIKASNLVDLHDGARLKDSRIGKKKLGEKL